MDLHGTRHTHDMFPCDFAVLRFWHEFAGCNLNRSAARKKSWAFVTNGMNDLELQRPKTEQHRLKLQKFETLLNVQWREQGRMQIIDCEYLGLWSNRVFEWFFMLVYSGMFECREHFLHNWSWIGPDCVLILKAPSSWEALLWQRQSGEVADRTAEVPARPFVLWCWPPGRIGWWRFASKNEKCLCGKTMVKHNQKRNMFLSGQWCVVEERLTWCGHGTEP